MNTITQDMLPCIITCDDHDLFWIDSIIYDKYYFGNNWVCTQTDNPKLVITQAELQQYFPERFI